MRADENRWALAACLALAALYLALFRPALPDLVQHKQGPKPLIETVRNLDFVRS